jgi:hypothetical protein
MVDTNEIGNVPWTDSDLRAAFPEFCELYKARPLRNNDGGMKIPHAFVAWFVLRRLQPRLVLESGVWKGQGTWLIEQACPDARVVCLDIDLSRLKYRSQRAEYHEKDFSVVDFTAVDKADSLCFFDDHQNALLRLQQMAWKGFRRAMFEDNYPERRGDCYSLKKAFAGRGFQREQRWPASLTEWAAHLLMSFKAWKRCHDVIPPNDAHRYELKNALSVYYEAPPLVRTKTTRWGDSWDDDVYPTKAPLFEGENLAGIGAGEEKDYTWICYAELRDIDEME